MRVIQLVDKLNSGGGVPSFVYDLCFALRETGCDVTLIGILENRSDKKAPYEEMKAAGIDVIELNAPDKKRAIASYVPRLRAALKDAAKEDTVLNMHLKLSVLMGCMASRGLKNISCVETYHNTYLRYHLQFNLLRPFIKKYITVSETSRLELINDFHAPEEKVIAAPNGVDREKLRRLAGVAKTCKPEKQDYLSIVSVGRLSYEKNFAVAMEAMSRVCTPEIRYTMIGDGPDREKVDAARHGNENIVFTGALPRNEVLKHLASADLVIMPSLWEGRSILQMEAMAFDVPLVISDVPGLREPFDEKELAENETWRKCQWGYLVKTNVVGAYRDAVRHFSEHRELHEQMRKKIREITMLQSIQFTANKYLCGYNDAINSRVGGVNQGYRFIPLQSPERFVVAAHGVAA